MEVPGGSASDNTPIMLHAHHDVSHKAYDAAAAMMDSAISSIGGSSSNNEDFGSSSSSCGQSNGQMSLVELGKRLLAASRDGDSEDVRLLITKGAPFTTDWLGTSPLHLAAQYGHYDVAAILLKAGLHKDSRTKVDKTPLHIAAMEGHATICGLLCKNGATVDSTDMVGMKNTIGIYILSLFSRSFITQDIGPNH